MTLQDIIAEIENITEQAINDDDIEKDAIIEALTDVIRDAKGNDMDLVFEDLDDFDSSYLEDCIDPDGYLEIPAEILVEVRNDQQKLSNQNFVTRAPKDIVENEKSKLTDLKDELEKIESNLTMLT